MAEKINWNFVAQVIQGPSISGAGALDGVIHEQHDFTMPANTGTPPTHDVSVHSTGTGAMSLLIINCLTPGADVTYTAAASAGSLGITGPLHLDGPHIFMGHIAGDFLSTATALTFTNNTASSVEIQILVGRKAA